jgi:hypothetical protein
MPPSLVKSHLRFLTSGESKPTSIIFLTKVDVKKLELSPNALAREASFLISSRVEILAAVHALASSLFFRAETSIVEVSLVSVIAMSGVISN